MTGSRLRTACGSARRDLHHAGALFVARRLARRALAPACAWRTLCFYERDLSAPVPAFEARIPVDTRLASPEDLHRFRDTFARAGARWEEIERQSRRGDLCFIGVTEAGRVHFMWLTLAHVRVPAIGVTLRVGPGEGVVYSSYTDPTARGRSVQPAVANVMIRHEKSLGLRRHFYYVLRDNYAGSRITGASHAGRAAALGRTVTCLSLAGLRGVVLTGVGDDGRRPQVDIPAEARPRSLGHGAVWFRAHEFNPSLF
jgi:ribosomal protein S18 acetylase RimI-like enzyme